MFVNGKGDDGVIRIVFRNDDAVRLGVLRSTDAHFVSEYTITRDARECRAVIPLVRYSNKGKQHRTR